MARWTPGVKQAVIRDLKKGKSHIVSKREMWELINEGYPVEGLESRARGQEFLIRFKSGKQGKTMARKKDNFKRAKKRADELAKKYGKIGKPREFFVVYDPSYEQSDYYPYAIAGDAHLDTFFAGAEIVYSTEE